MAKDPRVSSNDDGRNLRTPPNQRDQERTRLVKDLESKALDQKNDAMADKIVGALKELGKKGDIKAIEKRLKERLELCKDIESIIDKLAPLTKKLEAHDLQTYHLLYKPDALFTDSPISPAITYRHLKNHMIKRDMDFIGYILDGKQSVKTFVEMAAELPRWVLRFANEPEKEKTGIEAIL